jgi:dihydroorotate dehydrogenase electron transfer subunit
MKYIKDFKVISNRAVAKDHAVLELQLQERLPEILPGQFVEVLIDKSKTTFLRRPFSIHDVNTSKTSVSLLIKKVGAGSETLSQVKVGEMVNVIFPLGKGYNLTQNKKVLLIGGGCGIAPLLYLARCLKEKNNDVHVLLGGRSKDDVLETEEFNKFGKIFVSTEDGSSCEKGMVTTNSILKNNFDKIYTCGPEPMLKAVAKIAKEKNIDCEVSLENTMACGIGACLCCVVDTRKGHQCVCTEGPVFNINELKWQI